MAHWEGAQGQAKMAKITQKHPYLWRSPLKTKKFFFRFWLQDLLNLQRVWTAL